MRSSPTPHKLMTVSDDDESPIVLYHASLSIFSPDSILPAHFVCENILRKVNLWGIGRNVGRGMSSRCGVKGGGYVTCSNGVA